MKLQTLSTAYRMTFTGEQLANIVYGNHYTTTRLDDAVSTLSEAYDVEFDGNNLEFSLDNEHDVYEEHLSITKIIEQFEASTKKLHKTYLEVSGEITNLQDMLDNENNQEMRNDIEDAIFDAKLPLICPHCGDNHLKQQGSERGDNAANCTSCDTHYDVNTYYMFD